ncbi:hypothetical protein [Rhodococcus sp. NPDC058521]|uniref:hypothetical protein n=1 Tax=Rhodococcus sp. NPDC058521 TaxID=3346536 RepID=UPI00366251F2
MIEFLVLVIVMIAVDRTVRWAGRRTGGDRLPRSWAHLHGVDTYRDDAFRPADPMIDFAGDREGRIAAAVLLEYHGSPHA